jgi:hypothetical protein
MINSNQAPTTQALEKARQDEFINWLRKIVQTNHDIDKNIHNLGLMPNKQAICYNSYDVNGFRFHIESYGQHKSTVNSSVCIKGEWNKSDTSHDFYGVLQEVVELDYEGHNKLSCSFQMSLV